jgi:hypothetical protein
MTPVSTKQGRVKCEELTKIQNQVVINFVKRSTCSVTARKLHKCLTFLMDCCCPKTCH